VRRHPREHLPDQREVGLDQHLGVFRERGGRHSGLASEDEHG